MKLYEIVLWGKGSMTLGVSALCYLLWVKQGYKRITGGVLYELIQSTNRTVIQCLTLFFVVLALLALHRD
jgi:hypothetical protein